MLVYYHCLRLRAKHLKCKMLVVDNNSLPILFKINRKVCFFFSYMRATRFGLFYISCMLFSLLVDCFAHRFQVLLWKYSISVPIKFKVHTHAHTIRTYIEAFLREEKKHLTKRKCRKIEAISRNNSVFASSK